MPPDDDHDCGWKRIAHAQKAQLEEQSSKLAELTQQFDGQAAELAAIKQALFGKKTEKHKLPPPLPLTKKPPADTQAIRKARRAQRDAALETDVVPLPVPDAERCCPDCGERDLRRVGDKPSVVYAYVHAHFRKRLYQRETLACACGGMVSAKPPPRVGDQTHFAPSFCAHVVVSKCADSIPLYRLAASYNRLGIPIARSTLGTLLHRAAKELEPLYARCLARLPAAPKVNADETSFRELTRTGKTFLWAFVTDEMVVYRYARTRSGEVPSEVLADSTGLLTVDQHSGYNRVTRPGGRIRGGCLAHARRHVFKAKEHPETQEALGLFAALYAVERHAKEQGVLGTAQHLAWRRAYSRPLFVALLGWARALKNKHEPRSVLGKACRYLLGHRRDLGRFLAHAELDLDNNKAEAALRTVALGRKNFLFVGHEQAGKNLAALYTLVATCQKRGINPIAYLTDALVRVRSHPAARIDELLPQHWKPPPDLGD